MKVKYQEGGLFTWRENICVLFEGENIHSEKGVEDWFSHGGGYGFR
jgi:hypothetical protein